MPTMWSSAPAELIQELGLFLGAREWAAARLVCRHWRAHVTSGVTLLELDLERSPHRWCMVGSAVRRLFPRLRSATLLVGTRVDRAAFAERMAELAFNIHLPELELRYVPISFPRLGTALADISGVTELRALRVLKLSGGPTPSVACIEALSSLRKLEELEVLPGDYGVLHSELLPPGEAAESPVNYGLTDDHCAPLERLTALTSLLIKAKPEAFTEAGLASLAALPELKNLVVYDAELPSGALRALDRATALTALQVGVADTASLAPLARLAQLEDLYLDTCCLEDVRQLPVAAAAAGLPLSGPRAVTGLYCVDQLFPSQEHLAALTELSGLKELVLEGPACSAPHVPPGFALLPPPPPMPMFVEDAIPVVQAQIEMLQALQAQQQAQAEAQAQQGGEQQQEGQQAEAAGVEEAQRRVVLDLSVLSRLTALEVLQLDKREEGPGAGGLELSVPPSAVVSLARGWGRSLSTLDLYNVSAQELPAESVAELTRLSALRSLSISSCPHYAATSTPRQMGWWQLPVRLTALGLTAFDLSDPGTEPWQRDPQRLGEHFSTLHSLRLHCCSMPSGMLPALAPALADGLHSLALADTTGTTPEDLQALSLLTSLSTLRLLPRDHGLGGLAKLVPLQLKQLKIRLAHLARPDLSTLSRLTSLFVLTLTAPMADNGEPAPGFASEVDPTEVELVLERLPYADLEMEGEPPAPAPGQQQQGGAALAAQ